MAYCSSNPLNRRTSVGGTEGPGLSSSDSVLARSCRAGYPPRPQASHQGLPHGLTARRSTSGYPRYPIQRGPDSLPRSRAVGAEPPLPSLDTQCPLYQSCLKGAVSDPSPSDHSNISEPTYDPVAECWRITGTYEGELTVNCQDCTNGYVPIVPE